MSKKLVIAMIVLIVAAMMLTAACGKTTTGEIQEQQDSSAKKITVYTTIFPLYDFSSKIGGEHVEVVNIVPPGVDSHDFEPTPRDLIGLNQADLFVYNGGGLEQWADDVLQSVDNSELVVVKMSDHITFVERSGGDGHDHGEEEDHQADEHEGNESHEEDTEDGHADEMMFDPHIWLDPVRAMEIANVIKEQLKTIDPEHQADYEQSHTELVTELQKLHEDFQEMAEQAKTKEVIVSHAAFGYLTDRYGLEQIAISGLSPSDEPGQKELAQIISLAREHDVQYIFFETLVNTRVAQMVQEQIGAEALVLNPLEGLTKEEIAAGKDYLSVMRENLENLRIALGVNDDES